MLDLEPIKVRVAAATSQPWEVAEAHTYKDGKQTVSELFVRRPDDDVSIAADILDPTTSNPSQANADFIAHTPADVRALIAEVERLRQRLLDAEQQASNAITWQAAMIREENRAKGLRDALKVNARLLARQCDLAREAETERDQLRRQLAEAALEAKT